MRKPPGLRLRFELEDTHDGALAVEEIESLLNELADHRLVKQWYPSVYEAEVFKFGGPAAIDSVHAYFYADSSAWWRWEEQQDIGHTSLNPRLLSVSVLNDLFAAFTDGPEEVWDVWCHIAVFHGDSVTINTPAAPRVSIDDIVDRVSSPEAALLRSYGSSNARLVQAFRALHAAGKLLVAHRLVLPHIALAHWNRYGFAPDDRASMYTRMIRAWSPYD
jgi:thiopeptide-type bacteriocin biosynthesis protein